MLIKSFLKSQFPHKSVILLSVLVIIEDKLTDLCGHQFLYMNTVCEMKPVDEEEDAVNLREGHPRVGDPAVLAELPKVDHAHREVVVD